MNKYKVAFTTERDAWSCIIECDTISDLEQIIRRSVDTGRTGGGSIDVTEVDEDTPIIELSLNMATEFYLGMYLVDGESAADTCWLKHSSDGWRISIGGFNLSMSNGGSPYFRLHSGTRFEFKEDILYFFSKWVRQESKRRFDRVYIELSEEFAAEQTEQMQRYEVIE